MKKRAIATIKNVLNVILGVAVRSARLLLQKGTNILLRYEIALRGIAKGDKVKSQKGRIGEVLVVYRQKDSDKVVGCSIKWSNKEITLFVPLQEISKI